MADPPLSTLPLPTLPVAEALCEQISQQLADFSHPTLQTNLQTLGAVRRCSWQPQQGLQKQRLQIDLQMPFVWQQGFLALQQAKNAVLVRMLGNSLDASSIEWRLHTNIATLRPENGQAVIPGVRNILAVSAAKGGVGKSSIAVNLALALAAEGGRTGLLDADIYGPSIPLMLGTVGQKPASPDGQTMIPISAHGISVNSIGYLLAEQDATIWRGPMASRALTQLLRQTLWPDLDYLVVDMPPGTGDLPLTLAKQFPVTAAIVITTPQAVALSDTMRGITLFEKVSVPILGIIENMSGHVCHQCGHHDPLFGMGGGASLSQRYALPLLDQLPLNRELREHLDQGVPTVVSQPDSALTHWFRQLAAKVAAELYWRGQPIATAIKLQTLST